MVVRVAPNARRARLARRRRGPRILRRKSERGARDAVSRTVGASIRCVTARHDPDSPRSWARSNPGLPVLLVVSALEAFDDATAHVGAATDALRRQLQRETDQNRRDATMRAFGGLSAAGADLSAFRDASGLSCTPERASARRRGRRRRQRRENRRARICREVDRAFDLPHRAQGGCAIRGTLGRHGRRRISGAKHPRGRVPRNG